MPHGRRLWLSLAVALEYQLVATPAWVAPCLQLLVHVLHQPAQASLLTEAPLINRPHVFVSNLLIQQCHEGILKRKCYCSLSLSFLLAELSQMISVTFEHYLSTTPFRPAGALQSRSDFMSWERVCTCIIGTALRVHVEVIMLTLGTLDPLLPTGP